MDQLIDLFKNDVIALGVLLLGGFSGGKLVSKLRFPEVTGYLLAGILLGYLDLINSHHLEQYRFIEVLGLSVVALIIGGSIKIKHLRKIGRSVITITLFQVVGTFLVVTLVTGLLFPLPLELCLLLGAIASATAPAATITVIEELEACGPLTETLLMVVALDDAACLILFGIISAIVNLMVKGNASILLLLQPLWEIIGSVATGGAIGFFILKLLRRFSSRHEVLLIVIGIAFLAGELGELAGLSALLLNMSTGMVLANFNKRGNLFPFFQDIELMVFVMFFTLAGASLDIKILYLNISVALIYVLSRAAGKIGGVMLGARISRSPDVVRKYLGLAMLPQAGVAIALVMAVQNRFPQYGSLINVIVLAAVTVNEVIGPVSSRFAIVSAKEAKTTVS
ncbi:MAG: cation:proton antiporter [bacterium]